MKAKPNHNMPATQSLNGQQKTHIFRQNVFVYKLSSTSASEHAQHTITNTQCISIKLTTDELYKRLMLIHSVRQNNTISYAISMPPQKHNFSIPHLATETTHSCFIRTRQTICYGTETVRQFCVQKIFLFFFLHSLCLVPVSKLIILYDPTILSSYAQHSKHSLQ